MDFHKYGLTEEQIAALENEYKAEVTKIKDTVREPYKDYDSLKANLQEANQKIKSFAKDIKSLTDKYDGLQAKYKDSILDNYINQEFFERGIKDVALFKTQINKSKLSFDADGNLTGLKEQVDGVQQKYAHLLTPQGNPLKGSNPPLNPDEKKPVDLESFFNNHTQISGKEWDDILNAYEPI